MFQVFKNFSDCYDAPLFASLPGNYCENIIWWTEPEFICREVSGHQRIIVNTRLSRVLENLPVSFIVELHDIINFTLPGQLWH